MRYDCQEKGGSKTPCPVDRCDSPDEETRERIHYHEQLSRVVNMYREEAAARQHPTVRWLQQNLRRVTPWH